MTLLARPNPTPPFAGAVDGAAFARLSKPKTFASDKPNNDKPPTRISLRRVKPSHVSRLAGPGTINMVFPRTGRLRRRDKCNRLTLAGRAPLGDAHTRSL